jgi:polyhydroxyalkanoate synthesis regulator phasin
MKRLIWLPIAGFLLIAGATVAAAMPGLTSTAASLIDTQDSDLKSTGVAFEVAGAGSLLDEVLADLVTQGVITQEQSDAIVAAVTTRADERRTELEAQRAQMEAMWTQIQGFLDDGVISADEIAQLPADNPFTNLQDILADGQVTLEELQSVGPFGGPMFDGPGRGHGHGFRGHGFWLGGPDVNDPGTDTTPTPSPDSSPAATS